MLSKERIAELKMYFTRCVQSRSLSTVVHLAECGLELIEMVEALQQENEQLRAQLDEWKYEVKCHMDEVIAREKQIEQLKVRVTRMRELLTKAYDEIEQTLAEIDKAIGGKAHE